MPAFFPDREPGIGDEIDAQCSRPRNLGGTPSIVHDEFRLFSFHFSVPLISGQSKLKKYYQEYYMMPSVLNASHIMPNYKLKDA
jgi:hypothetical protein